MKTAGYAFDGIANSLECPYCGFAKWDIEWLERSGWPRTITCSECFEMFKRPPKKECLKMLR